MEQDPAEWWSSLKISLHQALTGINTKDIQGVAISNQRETVAFLDVGKSLHDAMLWLDQRASQEVQELKEVLGSETIHRITGKPADAAPVLYRLRWLNKHKPQTCQNSSNPRRSGLSCLSIDRHCKNLMDKW